MHGVSTKGPLTLNNGENISLLIKLIQFMVKNNYKVKLCNKITLHLYVINRRNKTIVFTV